MRASLGLVEWGGGGIEGWLVLDLLSPSGWEKASVFLLASRRPPSGSREAHQR